ncbi:MAG: FeoB-associated Cys-rich membrane protein [Butyrivibrio sp.]|nr:FeoB-associated Cys-rich membrane protein [Butyrivibrio sp.]
MENVIIVGILLGMIGMAVLYICKKRKKGCGCIGCPSAGYCRANQCCNSKKKCDCDFKGN